MKIINFWLDARRSVYNGIRKVFEVVVLTAWAKGKNVILDKGFKVDVVNDGITVAKEIVLEDKQENVGATLAKEAAQKTNEQAGDGTTTTTILLKSIVEAGLRYVNTGVNPFSLIKGMRSAVDFIKEHIKKNSKEIKTTIQMQQIAEISAQDKEVGEMIAGIIEEIWPKWLIAVEEGKNFGIHKEVINGMMFGSGFAYPAFVNNFTKFLAEFKDTAILITDKEIGSFGDILKILQAAQKVTKNIVIIAEDFSEETLANMIGNKEAINCLPIKAPAYWDFKAEILEDIAACVGATVVSDKNGLNWVNATAAVLGAADKVISTATQTTIIGGQPQEWELEKRIAIVAEQINTLPTKYEQDAARERHAKLTSGVSIIRVCLATKTETVNKKLKIEDAINTAKSANEDGVIVGGGTSLVKIAKLLDTLTLDDKDEQLGVEILKEAIQEPTKWISQNAGYKGDHVVEVVKENDNFNFWFNAKTGKYEDLVESGVIDPVKVVVCCLTNATSTAAMVLTSEAMIVHVEDKKDK